MPAPTLADIYQAHQRIKAYIHRTPTLHSQALDDMSGAKLFFKCENFQKIGAFKARGAHNAVLALSPEELKHGVVTHSSGNHAAALALAARNAGTVAHVVMPHNAPRPKVESVQRLGGIITQCQPTSEDREATAARVQAETGATLVHPFNDWQVIAGQGTAALELSKTRGSRCAGGTRGRWRPDQRHSYRGPGFWAGCLRYRAGWCR